MSEGDDIAVRLLVPEEAPKLIALIRRCYGKTYIDPDFYRKDAVGALLRSGRLHSIGAVAGGDQLVGHMGISLRAHGGNTADAGMTLVDPSFRGRGIARRVAAGLVQEAMALGLLGVHDYPVTVHAATQRIGAGFGLDTGLMLANMPADVEFQEIDTPAPGVRTSSLIRWLPFGLAPEREVYLPQRYRGPIESLYAEALLERKALPADEELGDRRPELHADYDERRQTLRIRVAMAGADLAMQVAAELRGAVERGGLIAHVDLRLGDSATPAATEALRAKGFTFAGLLPEYWDGDVLRLQWLAQSVDVGAFSVLSSDATQAIEALVREDLASVRN